MSFPGNPHQGVPMFQNNRMMNNNQPQVGSIVQTPNGPMVVTPQGLVPYETIRQMMQQQQQQYPGSIQQQMQTGGMPQHMSQLSMNQIPQQMMPQYQNNQGFPNQQGMSNFQPMPMYGGSPMNIYPNQQRQMNAPAIIGDTRFGSADSSINQNQNNNNDGNNRFVVQNEQPQQIYKENEPTMTSDSPSMFSVTPVIHKFTNNKSAKLTVTTDALKKNEVSFVDNISELDSLPEAIECVIENAFEEKTVRKLTVFNCVIRNCFYAGDMKKVVDDLLVDNVKTFYKVFKSSYADLKDIRKITVMNKINTMFTDHINDYLATNASEPIDIDSFLADFNDLLKVLRNNEVDLEDNLIDYVNSKITDIKSNVEMLVNVAKEIKAKEDKAQPESVKNSLDQDKIVTIPESAVVAYLDKHVLETGLEHIGYSFVQLDKTSIINAFIDSIAAEIFNKVDVKEFYIVTMDKCMFKFMRNEDQDLFIKKVI